MTQHSVKVQDQNEDAARRTAATIGDLFDQAWAQRRTQQVVGFEGTPAQIATEINTWLLKNTGWAVGKITLGASATSDDVVWYGALVVMER